MRNYVVHAGTVSDDGGVMSDDVVSDGVER